MEKKNKILPKGILAFKLLPKANVTKKEKSLVLTVMDKITKKIQR